MRLSIAGRGRPALGLSCAGAGAQACSECSDEMRFPSRQDVWFGRIEIGKSQGWRLHLRFGTTNATLAE
jgi:hypothetical protein